MIAMPIIAMQKTYLNLAFLASDPFAEVVKPVVDLFDMIVGPALLLVGALGSIYCIILGVKLAKAEEQQDRDKAKGALKNALIGFISIFVLMVVLRLGLPALQRWADTAAPPGNTSSSSTSTLAGS